MAQALYGPVNGHEGLASVFFTRRASFVLFISVIINNGIDEGSQIPYIQAARRLGYGVIVTNTNQNVGAPSGSRLFSRLFSHVS
jgi:hypothetical protein